ncbi:MAG: hypothetical protein J6L77_10995 [Coprococcus sp.]|nr:hypothetical protein [Coprococcus sp.]
MATFYNAMLYGGLALAVIFAIIAVILFVKLNIPKVIGDLTGSTAKKQIQEIREKGYESVQGAGVSKKDAIKSASDTGRISARDIKSSTQKTAEAGRAKYEQAISALEKEKAAEDYLKAIHEDATDVLSNGYEEDATDILSDGYDEDSTDILSDGYDEDSTDILSNDYEDESTDILTAEDSDATDVLTSYDEDEATDILTAEEDGATDVLTAGEGMNTDMFDSGYHTPEVKSVKQTSVKKIMDVVVVHTEESI